MHNIQTYWNRNTGSSYFQTHLKNVAEDCKAILRYKTKISCMSKKSSKVLKNKNKQGMLSRSKIDQKLILVPGFWKSRSCFRIISSKIPCMLIFRKNENFWLIRPKLAKNESWDRNFENLSVILESAPQRYYVCQFLDKMDSFVFFDPNLP